MLYRHHAAALLFLLSARHHNAAARAFTLKVLPRSGETLIGLKSPVTRRNEPRALHNDF